MALTSEQIEENEDRIQREIADRQSLLEAYRLVREDIARNQNPQNGELPFTNLNLQRPTDVGYGKNTSYVRWAIANMRDDYDLRDLRHFLRGQGEMMTKSAIAIVLNRLRKSGEI